MAGLSSVVESVPKRARRVIKSASVDIVIVWAALIATLLTRAATTPLDLQQGVMSIAIICAFDIALLYIFGVYDRIWARTSGHGVTVILYATGVATALLTAGAMLIEPHPLPLSVIFVGNILAMVGFVSVRYRSRLVSGAHWRWRAVWHRQFPKMGTRTLIIGAGNSGQELALRMKHRSPENTYLVVGFIDDDPDKKHMYVEGCRVLGNRHDIPAMVERHNVDLIVLAVHNISGNEFRSVLAICQQTKAMIKVLPDLNALVSARTAVTLLRDVQPEDLLGRTTISRHAAVDLSAVQHRVVLITGAAGSIGSELSRQIMEYDPVKVILLDNNESGLHDLTIELQTRYPNVTVRPVLLDISQHEMLERLFIDKRPQVIFHAAAYKHVPMLEHWPLEALRVNIRGTAHLMQLARTYEAERFVFISTDKAVNPSSVMGASKRIGELMLHANALEGSRTLFTAVRFGNVLGSRGSVVPTFSRQIYNGGPVTVTHLEMTRYFMTIPEAANLIIHAACMTRGDDIYLLHMGEVVRIVDLAERMIRLRGLRPYKDIDIVATGVRPGEKLHEELYTSSETPYETIHPGIVQLTSWHDRFDRVVFWQKTGQLLAHSADPKTVLREMLAIINLNHGQPSPVSNGAHHEAENTVRV